MSRPGIEGKNRHRSVPSAMFRRDRPMRVSLLLAENTKETYLGLGLSSFDKIRKVTQASETAFLSLGKLSMRSGLGQKVSS